MSTLATVGSLITSDKDFDKIKKVISDFVLNNNKFPSIEDFNENKPNDLNKINYYLMKYDVRYDFLLEDTLGYTQLRTKVQNRTQVFHKEELLELLRKDFEKNGVPKAKKFKRQTRMSLETIKNLYGFTYLELLEHLDIKHPLLDLKNSREYDISKYFTSPEIDDDNDKNQDISISQTGYSRSKYIQTLIKEIDKGANISFVVKSSGDIVVSSNNKTIKALKN